MAGQKKKKAVYEALGVCNLVDNQVKKIRERTGLCSPVNPSSTYVFKALLFFPIILF